MPTKKKTTKRKTRARVGGLVSFTKKLFADKSVKSKSKKIAELERKLKAAKKEKALAVKKVRTKLKKK